MAVSLRTVDNRLRKYFGLPPKPTYQDLLDKIRVLEQDNNLMKRHVLLALTEQQKVERLAARAVAAAETLLSAEGLDVAQPLRKQMNNIGEHLDNRYRRTASRIGVFARRFQLPMPTGVKHD